MVNKTIVLTKLGQLKDFSVSRYPDAAGMFDGIYSVVEDYFSSREMGSIVGEIVQFMYFDIARRTTVYEHQYDLDLPSDFPAGYFNVEECFYQFSELLSITNLEFYNAFTVDEEGLATNAYLSKWAAEIPEQKTDEIKRLKSLCNWLQASGGNADLVSLLEDQGRIISALSSKDITKIIYLDRNIKQLIVNRNLSVHIPSYL